MKHTPGPWTIINSNSSRKIESSDGQSLMCDEQFYPWVPENEGDWNLIAAAPDMLECLHTLFLEADLEPWQLDLVRKVIAKAEVGAK